MTTPRHADRARGALTIVLSDGLERGDPAEMVAAVQRLARLSHDVAVVVAAGTPPGVPPVTRAMAAIVDDVDLAGVRDLESVAGKGARAMSGYVDAHHHIWRVQDMPWLSGPMIPRIFGPYESLQKRVTTSPLSTAPTPPRTASCSRSTCRPNWPLDRSVDEVEWVQSQHEETGWPSAIVGSADLLQNACRGDVRRAGRRLSADARLPAAGALA